MTIYLNKNLQHKYRKSREEMIKKYDIVRRKPNGEYNDEVIQPYQLTVGAPLYICVDGTYIDVNDLVHLAKNSRTTVLKFVSELKSPSDSDKRAITFVWG